MMPTPLPSQGTMQTFPVPQGKCPAQGSHRADTPWAWVAIITTIIIMIASQTPSLHPFKVCAHGPRWRLAVSRHPQVQGHVVPETITVWPQLHSLQSGRQHSREAKAQRGQGHPQGHTAQPQQTELEPGSLSAYGGDSPRHSGLMVLSP